MMMRRGREFLMVVAAATTGAILYWIAGCDGGGRAIPIPEAEGKGIGGSMAFDGEYFWGTQIELSFRPEAEKEIVKFDRFGNIVGTFTPEENFSDLAFDGETVWTADAFGSAEGVFFGEHGDFYTVDRQTGALSPQFVIREDYMLDGLSASEGRLWALVKITGEAGFGPFIFEIDPESQSVVNRLPFPRSESSTCSGMTYADGHLWLASGLLKREILKIDPSTGEIVKRYDCAGRVISGITTDGEDILLADNENHKLFALKK